MQLTHEDWYTSRKETASTAAQDCGTGPAMKAWRWPGVLASLFLASTGYVVLGGAFEWPSGHESQTRITAVAVGDAPLNQSVSVNPETVSDYFPAAYPNRGRDGDGNVMTYEHD
jgi:hypothetical protein